MRRLLLPLLFSISLPAYTINFDKSFEIALKPDTLTTDITITTQKPLEKEVLQKLTSFSTFISGYKEVEKKGGTYSIYPEYRYENNRRFKNGYKGTMHYQISTSNPDDLNSFIANLHDKKKDFDVDISLSSVSWQLSPKQKEGQLDKLRLDAILWINHYAKTLSSNIPATCNVSKISLSAPSFDYPRPVMMEAKGLAADIAPTPEQDEQKISIHPHFELECK
jgi:uncharacterized protein YggE